MSPWKSLVNTEIQTFVKANESSDVAVLALKKPPDAGWPYRLVLDQIKSRQKARVKIPAWLETEGIILPAPDVIEQASSGATARYKASLAGGGTMADLTAGAGVDFSALVKNFKKGIAVEQDKDTAEILKHNLEALNHTNFEVINARAEDAANNLPTCNLVYIDPQRRTENKKGLFRFEDCTPDILALLPALKNKAAQIIIKASPVMDINRAIADLGAVSEAHIVEWRGECREILYVLKSGKNHETVITPVIIDDEGRVKIKLSFTRTQESESIAPFSNPLKFLFEPSPAFQKSGCYKFLCAHYGVKKIAQHTHLYTSDTPCPDFPGRAFEVAGIFPAGGKALSFSKANLSIRNFPGSVEDLKKKLKIQDGGDDYLFACTLSDASKALIHGRKTL